MSRKVKRVDLFIEAARMVLSRARQARFFIVGDGRLRNSLQQLKEKHGLGDSVLFLGKDFDTRFFLSALDIGVITSDSEGLSNSVMEYMASGIPTVASDVGGNRELIRHNQNGCLFRRGDPEDLAEKISDLIINTEKRRAYGRQAASDIRSYDWPARIHEMLDYYRRQLNHGGQGK
jgi:glycosyltransferase involved in cell wall biosynthesis